MNSEFSSIHPGESYRVTLRTYIIGFVVSIVLTLIPYAFVISKTVTGSSLLVLIFGSAILQLIVQTICFLHVSGRSKTRWNFTALLFSALIVCIIVGGSLWIMQNLNYNLMGGELDAYMNNQN